jgi:hypothetical protein
MAAKPPARKAMAINNNGFVILPDQSNPLSFVNLNRDNDSQGVNGENTNDQ